MRIKEVIVKGYRSLRSVDWQELDKSVVVFGSNAVGKSNLLRLLNLLLVRVPNAAVPNRFNEIRIPHEPAVMHPLHAGKTIEARIVIEQDLAAVRSLLDHAVEKSMDAGERDVVKRLLTSIEQKPRAVVEMEVHLEPVANRVDSMIDGVGANVKSVVVDGHQWFGAGTSPGRKKARRGEKEEPSASPNAELLADGHKLLIALTQGFVYVDCPRVLETNELRVYPKGGGPQRPETAKGETNQRLFQSPNWWLDIDDKYLASRLHGVAHDPQFARRFERLRRRLVEDGHGWLGVRSFFRDENEILELFLSELNALPRNENNPFYIPANFQGTGFIQKLYILAACYLSGASVVGIEELEVNLAPQTQRDVWRWLRHQTSRAGSLLEQVIVTSHSPIFLEGVHHGHDVGIWYASLDGDHGTKLERLGHDGQWDPVRDRLRKHFGPMDSAFWTIGSEAWRLPGPEGGQDNFQAMYLDDSKFGDAFDAPTLGRLLTDTADKPEAKIVFLEARRLSIQKTSNQYLDLFGALGIRRWVPGSEQPRQLRVEWTEIGTGNAERTVRVEGSPSSDGSEQTLILVVEERVTRGNMATETASEFFSQLKKNMADILSHLQDGLSGG